MALPPGFDRDLVDICAMLTAKRRRPRSIPGPDRCALQSRLLSSTPGLARARRRLRSLTCKGHHRGPETGAIS